MGQSQRPWSRWLVGGMSLISVLGTARGVEQQQATVNGGEASVSKLSKIELPESVAKTYAVLMNGETEGVQENGKDLVEVVRATMDDNDLQLQPICMYLIPAAPFTSVVCLAMGIMYEQITTNTPDYSDITSERQADNWGGALPKPLLDLRGRLPKRIDQALIAEEKPTYYWYTRYVFNLYYFVFQLADITKGSPVDNDSMPIRPLVPEGWKGGRVWFYTAPSGYRWPIAQTVRKDGHLVFFIRGTMFPSGWKTDFRYAYGPVDDLRRLGIPGNVHYGFYDYTRQYLEDFQTFIVAQNLESMLGALKEITFAGHSLGGAMSILSAAFFAARYPDIKINVVGIASAIVGDAAFSDWVSDRINIRRISYLGPALGTAPGLDMIHPGVGDTVPQMALVPACPDSPMPYCENLRDEVPNPQNLDSFTYKIERGNVPFYITDLPNQDRWMDIARFGIEGGLDEMTGHIIANHICAYSCWLTQGMNDPDDRCYFEEDGGDHEYRCLIKDLPDLQQRFPKVPQTSTSTRRLRSSDTDAGLPAWFEGAI